MAKPKEIYQYNLEKAQEMIFDIDNQYNFAKDDSDEGTECKVPLGYRTAVDYT